MGVAVVAAAVMIGVAKVAVPPAGGSMLAMMFQVADRFSLVSSWPPRPLPPVRVSVPSFRSRRALASVKSCRAMGSCPETDVSDR